MALCNILCHEDGLSNPEKVIIYRDSTEKVMLKLRGEGHSFRQQKLQESEALTKGKCPPYRYDWLVAEFDYRKAQFCHSVSLTCKPFKRPKMGD